MLHIPIKATVKVETNLSKFNRVQKNTAAAGAVDAGAREKDGAYYTENPLKPIYIDGRLLRFHATVTDPSASNILMLVKRSASLFSLMVRKCRAASG